MLDSNLHISDIWRLERDTSVYISEKISTSFLLSRYVCSYIKTNCLLQYQTRTTEGLIFFLECTSSEY